MHLQAVPDAKPLDNLALCGAQDAPALILRDDVLDYKALNLRVGKLASWLISNGLRHGDRVATWCAKTELACLMPLATARAGLVHVPINPLLKRAQVAHILADSGAYMLCLNAARRRSLEDADIPEGCRTFDEAMVHEQGQGDLDAMPGSAHDPDDLAAILYTSGSTGKPKGVMLSHANMWLGAVSVAHYLGMKPDDKTLCVLPLSFDYGQNQLLSSWYAGATAIPLDYLAPKDVTKACAQHGITTLAAVPPLWIQLGDAQWPEEAVSAMRRLTNSGGALTPTLVASLRAIFADADIVAMYGLTEAFRSTYLDPALIDTHPTSMGKAIPFAEILVVNDQGGRAVAGEEGELVHIGPLVAKGYWQDEARTAERFMPAPEFSEYGGTAVWSGDRVRHDADGLLHFVGRRDAMIKSSGNRISPAEIETVALESGLVSDALAAGVTDNRLGQAIVLFARPAQGVKAQDDEDKLVRYLKQALPNFMVPHHYMWMEEFPKNPNGKIDRARLIAEFQL